MKKNEIQELKMRPVEELSRMVREANERLRTLRFDLAAGKVKDESEIRELKKKVARMKTFIHEQSKQSK
jgi:large subunit ribosomal protein L29